MTAMTSEELRTAFAELPPIAKPADIGDWDWHRYTLRKNIEKDNIERFLNWSTIQATMFVGDAPYIKGEYGTIKDNGRLMSALEEDNFGSPLRLPWLLQTSGNMVHQAYRVSRWELLTGKRIDQLKCIVEFGGGYGAMARLISRLGFVGQYIIYDLPEFSLLQQYYLSNVGVEFEPRVVTELEFAAPPPEADLFIALNSIDESPEALQKKFFSYSYKSYLIVDGMEGATMGDKRR